MADWTREKVETLDQADSLAAKRAAFKLPEGLVYLDGNSLGPITTGVEERLREVVTNEWGEGLIRSWNDADWINLPARLGAKIAPLIGARPSEVIAADSTSVNLFKMIMAAISMRKGRSKIITEADNFPTDFYIIESVARLTDMAFLALPPERLMDGVDDETAVLVLTHVNYRTGEFYDMETITRRAHDHGVLVVWDLSHSAGAMPIDLDGTGADFAVGCGYKYLNGGPGAPAYLYVAERHQAKVDPVLCGWMGHASPFEFSSEYKPADGVARNLCGTPGVLGMAVLETALEVFADVNMERLREKSMQLGDLFIDLIDGRCGDYDFKLLSPRDATARASQVSFAHKDGFRIMQALISKGVIGDFRAPDVMRFGLTPLYLRHVDIWDAVETLREIMEKGLWREDRFDQRQAVT